MTRTLLIRGMLAGIVAGLLVFCFARLLGEPQVDRAIAFETAADQARGEAPEPEVFSRHIQKTVGLFTAAVTYSAALGGIFGLVFAFASGRVGPRRPRALAAFLASLGFLVINLVPSLKYPANPPAVGNAETIGLRTTAYFLMIALSVLSAILALQLGRSLTRRVDTWNATLLAAAFFIALVALLAHFLPVIDEVPANFPADLLWRFRLISIAIQLVLWSALGLLFGALTERDPAWSTSR
jgi:predicted cobalt transporter CbtA